MPLSTNDVLRLIDKRWFLPFAIAVMCVLVIILPLAVGGLHASGDLTVNSALAVTGTLLVPAGKLIVKSSNMTITPASNMPVHR